MRRFLQRDFGKNIFKHLTKVPSQVCSCLSMCSQKKFLKDFQYGRVEEGPGTKDLLKNIFLKFSETTFSGKKVQKVKLGDLDLLIKNVML